MLPRILAFLAAFAIAALPLLHPGHGSGAAAGSGSAVVETCAICAHLATSSAELPRPLVSAAPLPLEPLAFIPSASAEPVDVDPLAGCHAGRAPPAFPAS